MSREIYQAAKKLVDRIRGGTLDYIILKLSAGAGYMGQKSVKMVLRARQRKEE